MSLLLPGGQKRKTTLVEKTAIVLLILIVGRTALPILTAYATDLITAATQTVETLAPKVAIGAGVLAAVIGISPLHRTHAGRMFTGSLLAIAGVGMIPTAYTWIYANAPGFAVAAGNALQVIGAHFLSSIGG